MSTDFPSDDTGILNPSFDPTLEERRIPIAEEDLIVHKQTAPGGEIEVRKHVTTQDKTIEVPLSHEEVRVRERPAGWSAQPSSTAFTEETIRIPIQEEHFEIEKRPRVISEVVISKETVQEIRQAGDSVRREWVEVVRQNNDASAPHSDWSSVAENFHQNWTQHHRRSRARWEDVEPAYRLGYESVSDTRYDGRSFEDVEPELVREWAASGHRTPWSEVRQYVREAWRADIQHHAA